jgi:pyruvate/2-oxoglutarate dehydrogenase complex dihydrolipoamide dehydrogenase (E3) component
MLSCTMTTPLQHFDHVLVGTGQATGTLIAGLPTNETIAVIEGGRIGGTCVNVGCTPTKTLLASAKVAHMARRAHEYGVTTGPVAIDFAAVMARMNGPREAANAGMAAWLEGLAHVTLLRGWARFVGPKTLAVGDARIRGDRIYLNVGGRSRTLPIPGLDEVPHLDNVSILELDAVPEHLVVVGGSYIGLEFAQIFRRFGARVSVLEAAPQIMFREDADVAEAAQEILAGEGIDFRVGVTLERFRPGSGGGVEIVLGDGEVIAGSHVLLAVGRVPNADRLDLAAAGIETGPGGFITVDDHTRTNVDGVFALGDVNGRGAFTHTSVHDTEVVLDTMRGGDRRISERITTYAMFTDPPLARVGLTEKEARANGLAVRKATRAMKRIGRAKEMGETQGFVKILVDADTDRFLGASILGVSGDEVINTFAAFMTSGAPASTFRRAVLVHPTISELMPWILDDLAAVEPEPVIDAEAA